MMFFFVPLLQVTSEEDKETAQDAGDGLETFCCMWMTDDRKQFCSDGATFYAFRLIKVVCYFERLMPHWKIT